MITAFASSMLKSEKIIDPNIQIPSHCGERASFLTESTGFSAFDQGNTSFQKNDALIFTSDTFMAGCHFHLEDYPQDLDPSWLLPFKATLVEEQDCFHLCSLGCDIGITSGPLTITFTFVTLCLVRPKVKAQLGDCIYVTGFLSDREMGHFLSQSLSSELQAQLSESDVQYLCTRYFWPDPHIILVSPLLPFINTCLSLGEGLVKNLTHLCSTSSLQAYIDLKSIPRSDALQRVGQKMSLDLAKYGFSKGEDRELRLTASMGEADQISYLSHAFDLPITPIGYMGIRQNSEDKEYVSWLSDDAHKQ